MKKILITGSTDGIGKLTAIQLCELGHEVLIHGRNPKKVENVISEIRTLNPKASLQGFVSDFSDFKSIVTMSDRILDSTSVLDVIINNAGVFKTENPIMDSGLDLRFVVNYLAPVLLTNRLMSLLKKSESPRIINLSSAAQSSVDLDALKGAKKLSDQEAYAQSKLALTMWSNYMSQRESNIVSIPVNPGSLLNTKMVQEAYGRHWSSAEKGSNILSDLAINLAYQNDSGRYFDNDKGDIKGDFSKAHPDAYDSKLIASLMHTTDSLLEI